ncbi:hypothetical protein HYDPIDRAFT_153117 [Hydnomerulius pinastri MD-312]|uniref:FAD-binding domain-containing protein n=1 Tax=Hydnomerulius pinastri MD-312 TaxID=994086 RepID=A0A0C9W2D8_9AGAM|nr:hypothetical protein HYDPIDRAFT_153117 [Hydnomerulius pinastri MD-312]
MTTNAEDSVPPVLVVGAGLAGLVAALTLVKNGIRVRIVEKNVEHRKGQRGAGIAPRSSELYHFLEVPEIERRMRQVPLVQTYHHGGVRPMETLSMFPPSEPDPSRPYQSYMLLGQDIMEGILREHLAKYGVDVEMGTELRTLKQHGAGVDVELVKPLGGEQEEKTSVEWVIGADGARGVVRKHLDVTFLGETRSESTMLVGDFRIKGLDGNHWHMWGTMASNFVAFRATTDMGPNGFVLFCSGKGIDAKKLSVDHEALFEWLRSVMERDDLAFEEVYWVSEFRPNIRMANRFSQGRVFITGGAAHVHSPSGGQGANSSVQDSFNLAWKLSLVIKGLSPPSLLNTYSEERVPVIAEMLKLTTHLLDKNIEADRVAQAKSWRRGEETYMLGVNYRGSRILVDDFGHESEGVGRNPYGDLNEDAVRAGDRAPDSPGLRLISGTSKPVKRLFDIFRPVHHTILVFTEDAEYISSVVSTVKGLPGRIARTVVVRPRNSEAASVHGADMEVGDGQGYAYRFYGVQGRTSRTIIVRPDGVVGAIIGEVEGVKKYFGLILSEEVLRYADLRV